MAPITPTVWNAARQLDTPSVTITVECDGREIFADAMIGKVFYNLFHNALRYGERVTRITVSCAESHEGLILSFEDNGVGIEQQNKQHIFKKGYGKDSGPGLFLIREILTITIRGPG